MSEFDPRYHLPRRSLTGPVITVVLTLAVGMGLLNAHCEDIEQEEAEYRAHKARYQDLVARTKAARAAQPNRPPAPTRPEDLPAEFELTWGDTRVDVTSARVKVDDLTLELVRPRRWRLSTPRLSLTYDPAVRVVATPGGAMLATEDGWASVFEYRRTGAASIDDVVQAISATKVAIATDTTSTVGAATLAGLPARGQRWSGPDSTFEALAAEAPSGRIIVATFIGITRNADLRDLRATVASAALEALPPLPTFVVTVMDNAGRVLDEEPAYLDRPVTLAGRKLVLRRRATIRAHIGDVTFERDPSMIVIDREPGSSLVIMRSDDINVTMVASPYEPVISDWLMRMVPSTDRPVTGKFGDDTYDGVMATRYDGVGTQSVEGYRFQRDGLHFLVVTAFPETRRDEALRLLTPVITSAR